MELIYPMYSMIILTGLIGVATAFKRIRAAYAGHVDPRYFKLMGNYEIPENIAKWGRNFNNQFEVPLLFYIVCIAAISLNVDTSVLNLFAWIFVALRVIHSGIHLTYNHPMHRFIPFFLSFICVFIMWTILVMNLSS